jgi:TP901 family phage tail tape measure protein
MADVIITTTLAGVQGVLGGLGLMDKGFASLGRRLTTAGRNMDLLGKSIRQTGTLLTASLTLPVAAAGVGILKTVAQFELGMNRVKALTSANTTTMAKLEKQARALGATTQFSAKQAADAMGFMAQAGFEADEIYSALPGTLRLAASAQLDMGRAADIVTNIMSGFRLESDQLDAAVDILTKTFITSNTDLVQLSEAMKLAGPLAAGLGVSIEETAAAMGILGNSGIQASLAGTTLRNVFIRLADPAKETATLLNELGLNAFDAEGNFVGLISIIEQLEVAGTNTSEILEIFAARAGPGMEVLLNAGSDALRDYTSELHNSGGTAERVAKVQMKGLNGAFLEFQSGMKELALAIGDSGVRQFFTDLLKSGAQIARNLAAMNAETLLFAVKIAAIAAILGPVTILLGLFVSSIGKFVLLGAAAAKILVAVAIGMRAVATALILMAPHIIVLTAIVATLGGLVILGIAIKREWKSVEAVLRVAWTKMKVGFTAAFLAMQTVAAKFFGALAKIDPTGFFDDLAKGSEAAAKTISDDLAGMRGELVLMDNVGGDLGDHMVDSLGAISDSVKDVFGEFVDGVSEFDYGTGIMNDGIDSVVAGMRDMINNALATATATDEVAFAIEDAFGQTTQKNIVATTQKASALNRAFADFGKGAKAGIREYFDGIADRAANMGDVTVNVLGTMEDSIAKFLLTGKFEFGDFFDAVKVGLAQLAAKEVVGGIGKLFGGLLGGGFLSNLGGLFGSAGSGVVSVVKKFFGFSQGGTVPGTGSGTEDTILAGLAPGEFVVNAASAKRNKSALEVINSGAVPTFAGGGGVGGLISGIGESIAGFFNGGNDNFGANGGTGSNGNASYGDLSLALGLGASSTDIGYAFRGGGGSISGVNGSVIDSAIALGVGLGSTEAVQMQQSFVAAANYGHSQEEMASLIFDAFGHKTAMSTQRTAFSALASFLPVPMLGMFAKLGNAMSRANIRAGVFGGDQGTFMGNFDNPLQANAPDNSAAGKFHPLLGNMSGAFEQLKSTGDSVFDGAMAFANGGKKIVSKPTMFMAGERGPESVSVSRMGSRGGGAGVTIIFEGPVVLRNTDVKEFAETLQETLGESRVRGSVHT